MILTAKISGWYLSPIAGGPRTLAQLEAEFPWIAWREPQFVREPHASGFACRACIANHGLHLEQIIDLPNDAETVAEHIQMEHVGRHHS